MPGLFDRSRTYAERWRIYVRDSFLGDQLDFARFLASLFLKLASPPEPLPGFVFIAGADGEFVLGVLESPPMCCCDLSPNILLSAFNFPRSAGVSFMFWRF